MPSEEHFLSPKFGPGVEVEFWRKRQLHIALITDQLKSRECQSIIGMLISQQSRLLRKWKTIDASVTDAANECKDINRILDSLQPMIESLHGADSASIMKSLNILGTLSSKPIITSRKSILAFFARFFRVCGEQIVVVCLQVCHILASISLFLMSSTSAAGQRKRNSKVDR